MHLLSAASDSVAFALSYPRFIRLFKLDEGVRIALHVLILGRPEPAISIPMSRSRQLRYVRTWLTFLTRLETTQPHDHLAPRWNLLPHLDAGHDLCSNTRCEPATKTSHAVIVQHVGQEFATAGGTDTAPIRASVATTRCGEKHMIAAAMIAASMIGFQGPATKPAPWQKFVSEEGQFAVDFPAQPTTTESKTVNGPEGQQKLVGATCATPVARFAIYKVTPFRKRANERETLIAARDALARQLKEPVALERWLKVDDTKSIFESTVRGKSATGVASTVRLRLFMAGQSLYVLMAAADGDREPPDVDKFLRSLSFGTSKSKKAGAKAAVPPKEFAGWGTAFDPDGDCEIKAQGKALVMKIPATLHDLNTQIGKFNAPRVVRDVVGDFEITVKVVGDFKPGRKSNRQGGLPFNGAGIIVCHGSDKFIRLERAAISNQGGVNTFAIFEAHEGGAAAVDHNGPLSSGTAFLRLERRGKTILAFTSTDGKRWTELEPIDTAWPAALKVGLGGINSGNAPFTVRFEELSFKANK
jgi:regulation of enolase protein 1 (concanavalin A-like superfamily)